MHASSVPKVQIVVLFSAGESIALTMLHIIVGLRLNHDGNPSGLFAKADIITAF